MKRKKIWMDIAVILLAFLLFVLWHQNTFGDAARAAFSNIRYYKVYLITSGKGYQFWGIMNQGAADMAASVGIEYIWEAPEFRSPERQIELIRSAVDSGADAILVAADDPKKISAAIEDAKARGVKIIYVDTPAYEEAITTLATDNYEAGVLAGQTMLSILNNAGINSGSIGILNLTDKENTAIREIGFRDTLAQDPRFQLLQTVYTETDEPEITQPAAEQIIDTNENLVALFGTSEGTSLGVGRAILANDNRYIGVGFDKTSDMEELLRAGSLKAIIDQNPYTMGYLGMAEAIAAIFGKSTGPEFINTGVAVVLGQ